MTSRNTPRTYPNSVRFDLLALMGVLVLSICVLVFRVAIEGNERRTSVQNCSRIEAKLDRLDLDISESRERSGLLLERYALEDRVAFNHLDLIDSDQVERIDLRSIDVSAPTLAASR